MLGAAGAAGLIKFLIYRPWPCVRVSSTDSKWLFGEKDGFPAPGLKQIQRFITGHNDDGKGVFLSTDNGDHTRIMFDGRAVSNIVYSTQETPVNLKGDSDVKKAGASEV